MKKIFKNDIRERVLFLSIIPMLLITCILGFFFTYTQIKNTHTSMVEKGEDFSRLLAAASEFGILSSNPAELDRLSRQLIENPLVLDVIYMDQDMYVIHRHNDFDVSINFPPDSAAKSGQHWYFSYPVLPKPIQIENEQLPVTDSAEIEAAGWVTLVFSDDPIRSQQYQIIRNSLFIILLGFLLTFSISNVFGRKISEPITQLSNIIGQLRRGNLTIRASHTHTEEFTQLAEGINELARSLEESNHHMETRITQATQALSVSLQELERKNHQLMRAHQKADSANRAKDAFLARMSHELRTPLTSVIGFTRMIQEGSSEEERSHYLQIIDHTSQMLLTLIDDLLDFTRLEADALDLETIDFHPEKLFHQALEMQAPNAHAKGLELILSGIYSLPLQLSGDPTRIRQIITNLVSNAIKFTEKGHIQLHAEYISEKSLLRFHVIDTGIGIANDYKGKMFESFTQADNSISRKYGGSGLGLAIIYRLIKLMKGKIQVDSEFNTGSVFNVEIPLTATKELMSISLIDDFSIKTTNIKYNILVVEKSSAARKALLDMLDFFSIDCKVSERIEDILGTDEQYTHILLSHAPTDPDLDLLSRKTESLRQSFPSAKIIVLLPASLRRDSLRNIKAQLLTKPIASQQLFKALESSAEEQSQSLETGYKLDKLEILVAEDNDYNRLLIKRVLKQAGIKTREATTGTQAIEAIHKKMPDIILMDINMPDMDGIEASRKILEDYPKARIIALTANISSREQQMLNQLGISKILIKPLNIEKLYALLSTLDFKRDITSNKSTKATTNKIEFELEITRQLNEIQKHIYAKDYEKIAINAHQLHGFAGLFEHPEIEMIADKLKKAVASKEIRNIWSAFNQLARVIQNMQRI